jgi:2-polyprenyl-3-methyl-5-hydroxy-6-metoxy-1,4-benzoquinol methylase
MPFDRDYYQRFYYDPKTAVTTKKEMQARAHLIAAFADHTGLPVRRILDAGCGTGMLRAPLLRRLPRAQYTGLETSEYLCKRYGWEHGQIDTYEPTSSTPFDLVICYDVLQYLKPASATRAIENFSKLCRGILYFSALTKLDWDYNCDTERTDSEVYLRSGNWYRNRLRLYFSEAGAGFWLRKGAPLTLWELESV